MTTSPQSSSATGRPSPSTGTPSPADTMPLPPRYFRWYLAFWHVIYLGGVAFLWITTLLNAFPHLGWRELVLTVCVIGQVLLYVRYLILGDRWPFPWQWLVTYFLGSLALWLIEWRLEPSFYWLIWSYFGQMFGIMPPTGALPATAVLMVIITYQSVDGDLSALTPGYLFGLGAGWVSFAVLFLYIYNMARTSYERGRLINELKAAQNLLEAAHQRESELAVLRERERLARDLHDSLGHALVTLSIQLEAVQRLYKVDPDRASAQVDELKVLTRNSMDGLRASLAGLRTPGLDERPLRQAMQELCVETGQQLNFAVVCHVDDLTNDLTPAVAETLWRTTQEALTNVSRHARAHQATVDVSTQAGTVILRVIDDGVGLPPDAENRPGHYGLRGIRERVEGLGGTLKFTNGNGTTLEAILPVIAPVESQHP